MAEKHAETNTLNPLKNITLYVQNIQKYRCGFFIYKSERCVHHDNGVCNYNMSRSSDRSRTGRDGSGRVGLAPAGDFGIKSH